jgi:hypothetical protein
MCYAQDSLLLRDSVVFRLKLMTVCNEVLFHAIGV